MKSYGTGPIKKENLKSRKRNAMAEPHTLYKRMSIMTLDWNPHADIGFQCLESFMEKCSSKMTHKYQVMGGNQTDSVQNSSMEKFC